jgi:hypothetical protein
MLYLPECYRSRGARQVVEPPQHMLTQELRRVRSPRGPQVVYPRRGGRSGHRHAGVARPSLPDVDKAKRRELAAARKALLAAR